MKIRLLIVGSFFLTVIVWHIILTKLFAGSLGDLFGISVMILVAIGMGLLYVFCQKFVKNIIAKMILYLFFLVSLLLIHPIFHFSYPQPYDTLKLTQKYLNQYDSIKYNRVYEDFDIVLKTIALYKFEKKLPERGFVVHYGIPQPTTECPGCSDDYWFFIECNGLTCTSTAENIKIFTKADTVFFEGYYKDKMFKFYYENKDMKPFLNIDKKYWVSTFELDKVNNWGYFGLLNRYLKSHNYKKYKTCVNLRSYAIGILVVSQVHHSLASVVTVDKKVTAVSPRRIVQPLAAIHNQQNFPLHPKFRIFVKLFNTGL